MVRPILFASLTAALLLSAAISLAGDGDFRPRIGCIPFLARGLQVMAFTENISAAMQNGIDRTGHFEVVERRKIEQLLELEGLRLDNLDQESVLRLGRKAGLDYLVYGWVSANDAGTVLELNLLEVRGRTVLARESLRVSESDFSQKLARLAAFIGERVRAGAASPAAQPQAAAPEQIGAPRNLEASGSANSIRLIWLAADKGHPAGYNVLRGTGSEGPFTLHATTTETSYLDESLRLNEVFFYRVASVGMDGRTSEPTPPVRGATVVAPPAPIFMNVEPEIKGARLAWRIRPGGGDDPRTIPMGFRVYRGQGGEGSCAPVARVPRETLVYTDGGLVEGTNYFYVITAVNGDGAESEYSARLGVAPLPAPGRVRVTGGGIRQVLIAWDQYRGDGVDGYVLYRSGLRDGNYAAVARIDGPANTAYTDRDLADNASYWYRLSVFRRGGPETAMSEPVQAVTRDLPPPPVELNARGGQPRMVTLGWRLAGSEADEIRSVLVFRLRGDKAETLEKVAEVPAERSEYVDGSPPLPDNTLCRYRVAARNSGGAVSRMSEPAAATTKAPPATPSGVRLAGGEVRRVTLSWEKGREPDIREYQLYRRRSDESDFTEIRTLVENGYTDGGLADGVEYSYRVRAVDRDGLVSPLSEPVSARTRPRPARVTGLRVADQSVRAVSWQPSAERDVRSYVVYRVGFLGVSQKAAVTGEARWQVDEQKAKVELYVTAMDDAGLESEPSETVVFEQR